MGKPKAEELLEHLQAEFAMEMYDRITLCGLQAGKQLFLDWFIRLLAENSTNSERLDVSSDFFAPSPKAPSVATSLGNNGREKKEMLSNLSSASFVLFCLCGGLWKCCQGLLREAALSL
jgi:hypothetical protein